VQKYYSLSILKFIKLFFLLEIVLIANVMASPIKLKINYSKPVLDTIIQLDSIKDKKLYNLGKPKPPKGAKTAKADTAKNKKGGSGLDDKLTFTDDDSTIVDKVHNILYLYGSARVKYQDIEMDADYIRVDQKNHLIFAMGSMDPTTHKYDINRPLMKQGKDKPVESDSLLFNYITKKGKIYNPASSQDENYISGGQARKLSETQVAYRNVLFSTCDKPFPETDFGIVITKGIGEKNRIISGPAYLEIEGVPLPLAIPFGFFPKPDHRTSGVILPTFGEDQQLGFYIRNLGYYIALNDYIDLTTEGTLYSKGSYDLNVSSRYISRYLYSGSFSLSYGSHNYGLEGDPPAKDFNITWSHTKNPNASPGSTFSASVNAGTSSFYQDNPASTNYNLQALTQNNLSSSISYSKQWIGTPFNLSISLAHSQDLTAKTVTLNLPTIAFNMSTLSPFDSKDRVGEQKWYQKITVGYSLQATNLVNAVPENQLFQGNTLFKKMQNGVEQQIPIGFNQTILKYFQFSASANYTEYWYLQTIRESYDRNNLIDPDAPVIDTVGGFKRAGSYNLSAGFSTKVYGTMHFKKGKLTDIRQIITPSIAFQYRPDFSDPSFGYYKTITSNAVIPYPATYQTYSIFQNGVYGGPSSGRSAGLNFSVDNTIEAKVRPKSTDTSSTPKHVKILDGLTFSTFYNFAADSFKLSPITFSGHTAVFNQKVNITFSGTLNPYVTDVRDSISSGTIVKYTHMIDRYTWQDGKFPMLENISLSLSGSLNSTSFSPKPQQPAPGGSLQNMNPQEAQKLAMINSDPGAYIDFNIPWNITANYTFSYQNALTSTSVTNTIMLSGSVRLTDKWQVQYSTNYDLRARQLGSATSFSVYRDLHCWNLSFQWLPFGYYKSYNVTLKVNSAILQDLKLSKKSDYTSNSYFNNQ
jgi:lipopolysaccharide assembly outer membrane protein LptD (OstA)